ncbi:acyl-CoA N-acyltransferase [Xylaria intraflava]|nr:acyl-CoA N-acyltransferase [Xylaria intraflava]
MFKVVAIPADEDGCRFYLEQYKPLRLASLQRDAGAFKSTYARESGFDDEAWLNRIRNPLATTFVAIRADSEQVVASASLMGPFPNADANSTGNPHQVVPGTTDATKDQDRDDDDTRASGEPLRFEMAAVYTHPEVRRQGLATSLIEAATEEARSQARRTGRPLVLAVVVYVSNDAAISVYERCGFVRNTDGPGLGSNNSELEMYFQAS